MFNLYTLWIRIWWFSFHSTYKKRSTCNVEKSLFCMVGPSNHRIIAFGKFPIIIYLPSVCSVTSTESSYSCYFPDAWHCDKRNSTCPGSDTPFKNAYDSLIRLVDSLTKAQIIWMIKGKWFWIMITVKIFCNEMMGLAIILGFNVQSWAKGTFLEGWENLNNYEMRCLSCEM